MSLYNILVRNYSHEELWCGEEAKNCDVLLLRAKIINTINQVSGSSSQQIQYIRIRHADLICPILDAKMGDALTPIAKLTKVHRLCV
jgi:hypothetical protein